MRVEYCDGPRPALRIASSAALCSCVSIRYRCVGSDATLVSGYSPSARPSPPETMPHASRGYSRRQCSTIASMTPDETVNVSTLAVTAFAPPAIAA